MSSSLRKISIEDQPQNGHDGGSNDDEDLLAQLDAIDVDADFTTKDDPSTRVDEDDPQQATVEEFKLVDLKRRWQREEVYSPKYKLSKEERKEIDGIQRWLGVKAEVETDMTLADAFSSTANYLSNLFFPSSSLDNDSKERTDDAPNRASVLWRRIARKNILLLEHRTCTFRDKECIFLWFNSGFAIIHSDTLLEAESWSNVDSIHVVSLRAWRMQLNKPKPEQPNQIGAAPEVECEVAPEIDGEGSPSIEAMFDKEADDADDDDDATKTSSSEGTTTLGNENDWNVYIGNDGLDEWLVILEKVIVQFHIRDRHGWGWQYRILKHRPVFSMAVTDEVTDDVYAQLTKEVGAVDDYQGWSPLHYAVKLGHPKAVQVLLEGGADPNLVDQEGESPADFADEHSVILELLLKHGAKRKVDRQKGELFGRVGATEALIQSKKEKQKLAEEEKLKADEEAKAVRAEMLENMRLMNERGEKIQDMSNKATELNQGATDFKSLAQKLKDKSAKQNKWLPF